MLYLFIFILNSISVKVVFTSVADNSLVESINLNMYLKHQTSKYLQLSYKKYEANILYATATQQAPMLIMTNALILDYILCNH